MEPVVVREASCKWDGQQGGVDSIDENIVGVHFVVAKAPCRKAMLEATHMTPWMDNRTSHLMQGQRTTIPCMITATGMSTGMTQQTANSYGRNDL